MQSRVPECGLVSKHRRRPMRDSEQGGGDDQECEGRLQNGEAYGLHSSTPNAELSVPASARIGENRLKCKLGFGVKRVMTWERARTRKKLGQEYGTGKLPLRLRNSLPCVRPVVIQHPCYDQSTALETRFAPGTVTRMCRDPRLGMRGSGTRPMAGRVLGPSLRHLGRGALNHSYLGQRSQH